MIMGLSSKQVSADGFDRSQGLWNSGDMEITKPPAVPPQPMRRQQQQQQQQRQAAEQQQPGPPLRCPRCDSTNTKFCYYNNYSRSQPRHFCKACRRHWTNGGTLRNVPVGGRRKAKRPKTSSHQPSAPNSAGETDGAIAGDGNDVPTTQPSQHVLPPPSFGQLLQLPLPPSDYGNNGADIDSSFLGALLPLPPVPHFGGGIMTSHDVNDGCGGCGYAPSTSSPFPPLLGFAGQDDLASMDAGMALAMAQPWESLPPSSCSSGPGGGSTVTTSGGPAVLEPSSPSSGYWGSWDDLTGFLSPDHKHPTPPLPPPQDLQLS